MNRIGDIISEIETLKHYRAVTCPNCNSNYKTHVLQLYANCPDCNQKIKCRAFGASGTELEDVIDAVLDWMGEGETFNEVMKRYEEIIADSD